MRSLITGDWHEELTYGAVDRREDIHGAINFVSDESKRIEADLFVHLGDVFDLPNPSHAGVTFIIDTFAKIERRVKITRIVAGNHDVYERMNEPCGLTAIQVAPYRDTKVILEPTVEEIEGRLVLFVPYLPRVYAKPAEAQKMINEIVEKAHADGCRTAFGHLNVLEARLGPADSYERGHGLFGKVKLRWPDFLRDKGWLIYNGHYHGSQMIPFGTSRIFIPGSVIRGDFGEMTDEKTYIVHEM